MHWDACFETVNAGRWSMGCMLYRNLPLQQRTDYLRVVPMARKATVESAAARSLEERRGGREGGLQLRRETDHPTHFLLPRIHPSPTVPSSLASSCCPFSGAPGRSVCFHFTWLRLDRGLCVFASSWAAFRVGLGRNVGVSCMDRAAEDFAGGTGNKFSSSPCLGRRKLRLHVGILGDCECPKGGGGGCLIRHIPHRADVGSDEARPQRQCCHPRNLSKCLRS